MINRKLWLGLVVLSLSPLMSASAAMMVDDKDDADNMMYFKLGYQIEFGVNHSIDGAKVSKIDTWTDPRRNIPVNTDSNYDPNYAASFLGGSFGVGKYFAPGIRAELEFAGNKKIEVGSTDGLDYFNTLSEPAAFVNEGFQLGVASLNVYRELDIDETGCCMPYVGGGIGIARLNFESSPTEQTITYPFAIQFKAGLQMKVNGTMPVYVGYKLVHLLEKESGDIKSFLPETDSAKPVEGYEPASGNVPTKGDVTVTGYTPEILPKAALPATEPLTAKIKSSYTLHSFDVGLMFVM